ncbi:MAG: hypothetical protein ACRC57_07635 [Sarcina sp.]
MSKKKHRDRKQENENGFSINPQILELLKRSNIDISKISTLMAAMNQNGFDINNINSLLQNNMANNYGNNSNNNYGNNFQNSNLDINKITNMLNNMDRNNIDINKFDKMQEGNDFTDDNIEMLLTIKSVVNSKKAKFLDKVIEMYRDGKIVY